jgi:hypothetical protein
MPIPTWKTVACLLLVGGTLAVNTVHAGPSTAFPRAEGFRGIWYALGQVTEHGDKYSGGLGTYTANHVPMAHYVAAVDRTYFTWGGTPAADRKHLQILISYFDHTTGLAARPVVVMDKQPVDDPHDNGSLAVDDDGHLWIFASGRGTRRPGAVSRSKHPHRIDDRERLPDPEFTYPQPWWFEGRGIFHTDTRYSAGRELYWHTSSDGREWNTEKKLAGRSSSTSPQTTTGPGRKAIPALG